MRPPGLRWRLRASISDSMLPLKNGKVPCRSPTTMSARSGRSICVVRPCSQVMRSLPGTLDAQRLAMSSAAASASTAYTRSAPKRQARKAKMPVPVPMSSTTLPGRTAWRSASTNGPVRRWSSIMRP